MAELISLQNGLVLTAFLQGSGLAARVTRAHSSALLCPSLCPEPSYKQESGNAAYKDTEKYRHRHRRERGQDSSLHCIDGSFKHLCKLRLTLFSQ